MMLFVEETLFKKEEKECIPVHVLKQSSLVLASSCKCSFNVL